MEHAIYAGTEINVYRTSAIDNSRRTVRDTMTHVEAVFRSAHGKGLAADVIQCGALANVARYRLPFEKTLAYVSSGDHVLDWGCGNGHFSYFLTQHGNRTVGLAFEDPPPMLAAEPLFRHVRHDDPVTLPFENAAFDAAVSMGVLEHVHETGGDQRASLVANPGSRARPPPPRRERPTPRGDSARPPSTVVTFTVV